MRPLVENIVHGYRDHPAPQVSSGKSGGVGGYSPPTPRRYEVPTIVEVENEIVEAGKLEPDHIHVPGIYVDRIVAIPPDGIWY